MIGFFTNMRCLGLAAIGPPAAQDSFGAVPAGGTEPTDPSCLLPRIRPQALPMQLVGCPSHLARRALGIVLDSTNATHVPHTRYALLGQPTGMLL